VYLNIKKFATLLLNGSLFLCVFAFENELFFNQLSEPINNALAEQIMEKHQRLQIPIIGPVFIL